MAIEFKHVNYTYGINSPFAYHALFDINLNINDQDFVAIIGQTGSGKSTLVQHMNGLLKPTTGTVIVDGIVIEPNKKAKEIKQVRKRVGLVFQFPEYQLFEETIEKDIMFGPLNFGVPIEDAKMIAASVLQRVGLSSEYLEKSPFDLSGGQKRRVAIAGILAMEPDVLILDEPTAGLDPQGAKEMMALFEQLHQLGKTIILITHDMTQVLQYTKHVIVMQSGKLEFYGETKELFKHHDTLTQLGLQLPVMSQLIDDLNKRGYHIDPTLKDMDELAHAIGGHIHE